MINKKIRQYIGLIAAVLTYYLIHEGAHLSHLIAHIKLLIPGQTETK